MMALILSAAPAGAAHFEGLGDLPGGDFQSGASGVSADGSVVVGYGHSASGLEAFRYPLPDAPPSQLEAEHALGFLPGGYDHSVALGVSADGSVVVGSAAVEGFCWTATGGMQGIGFLPGGSFSVALGVSADGSVVVGEGESA